MTWSILVEGAGVKVYGFYETEQEARQELQDLVLAVDLSPVRMGRFRLECEGALVEGGRIDSLAWVNLAYHSGAFALKPWHGMVYEQNLPGTVRP